MKYIIDIQPWSGAYHIEYSRDLENEISKTVTKWINDNIEHPGNWVTTIGAVDNYGLPMSSHVRIN